MKKPTQVSLIVMFLEQLIVECMKAGGLSLFDTAFEALNAVKSGLSQTYGYEWKIVRELEIKIEDENK